MEYYLVIKILAGVLISLLLLWQITLTKSNLEKKGLIWLTIPGYSPLLWRSQGRNLKYHVHGQEQQENKRKEP